MRKAHYPLILFLLLAQLTWASDSIDKNDDKFGVLASSVSLDSLPKDQPPLSNTGKSLVTLNKFGFDVLDEQTLAENWLVKEILETAKKPNALILDVGGGYGRLTSSITKINPTARVIYNDRKKEHLYYGIKEMSPFQKERVYLNTKVCPEEMDFTGENFLDAAAYIRVFHFMKPSEIEQAIEKTSRWLKPGGKIFIMVLSPQHGEYRDKVLEEYERRWEQGDLWPGYFHKSKDILPDQSKHLPEWLHVMDGRPLERILEEKGYTITKRGFVETMKKFGNTEKRSGQEAYGLIAMKTNGILSKL